MKRIGILGGTFDPVHNGHIKIAQDAYLKFDFDEIWFMPAPNPPHKSGHSITPFSIRFEMLSIALEGISYFKVSDFESHLEGKSYTARTLLELKKKYNEYDFSLIIGEDSFFQIQSWYLPEVILSNANIYVASRKYESDRSLEEQKKLLNDQYDANVLFINDEIINISSTDIKRCISENKSISDMVPKKVEKYIKKNKLYR